MKKCLVSQIAQNNHIRYYIFMRRISRHLVSKTALTVLAFGLCIILQQGQVSAACTPPASDFGSVSSTVSIPSAGSYRTWSRMKIPSTTNNGFMLEVDGTCYNVGGNSAMATNAWTWVDYQNGNSATKLNLTLSQGTHTVKMIGTSDGVQLDRIIFTQDTAGTHCNTAMGTGDNCANPPDTSNPTGVAITSPSSGAVLSGASTTINATASDDTGVTKVEFYIDGALKNTDTTAPYSFNWDISTVSDGSHSMFVKAYDSANNSTQSSTINLSVSNGKPDFIVTSVSWLPASPKVNDNMTFSATIKNNGSVAGVPGSVKFTVDGSTVVGSANSPASLAAGSSVVVPLSATSTWKATSGNHTATATVDALSAVTESNESNNTLTPAASFSVSSVDTTPPTVSVSAPSGGAIVSGSTVNFSANASDTGGSNLSRVEFYANGKLLGTDTSSPYAVSWNTTATSDGSYALYAAAYDGAGLRTQSATVTVTVKNSVATPKVGDSNNDNAVNEIDLSIVLSHWQISTNVKANGDLNGDGVVNGIDLSMILSNWKK